MGKALRREGLGLLFIAPWLLGFLAFGLYPTLASLYYSFTRYDIISSPQWIGLKNYQTLLFDDDSFRVGVAYGAMHSQVHQEDLARVTERLVPGHHRMRFLSAGKGWHPVECVCDRFITASGEFLILRAED